MSGALAFDRIVSALGDQYRRRLLVALTEHNPQPAQEPLRAEDTLDSASSLVVAGDTAEVALVHSHLPKLDELGYITWDREQGKISKGPDWEEIQPTIQLLLEHEDELGVEWL